MKVLGINGYFLLPDDFIGTEAEAIQLLSEYHATCQSQKVNPHGTPIEDRTITVKDGADIQKPDVVWHDFLKAVKNGYRAHMIFFCGSVVEEEE